MTKRDIRIAETSSFRYIGVQPPLTEREAQTVRKHMKLPMWLRAEWNGNYNQEAAGSEESPYTEFEFDVGYALDTDGRGCVDTVARVLACQIASILERRGDKATVEDDLIIATNFEIPLFGHEADRRREHVQTIRAIRALGNQGTVGTEII